MYNVMYIGNTNCKPSPLLNNAFLAVVDEVNDLSVNIDSRLTFHTLIRKMLCAPVSELI